MSPAAAARRFPARRFRARWFLARRLQAGRVTAGRSACLIAGLIASLAAGPPAGSTATFALTGRTQVEGGYTSSLFAGEASPTPDRFAVLLAGLGLRARGASGARVDLNLTAAAERYDQWTQRNAERYEAELRARAGAWRARARGRYSPEVLLFPDATGGARYRDREGVLEMELRPRAGLVAGLELRSRGERFDASHAGRTSVRNRWSYLAGWEPAPATRAAIRFENERSRADDSNYDFYENNLGLSAEAPVGPVEVRLETVQGVRNYFPASLFGTNYRRHDREQTYRLEVSRDVSPEVRIVFSEEYRRRDSTRDYRDYRQNTVRLALQGRLGR
ncbi:MAG: hypothetical protein HZB25_04270 [Candidatus Eisenbacteria bacterium]|nr:hypothetical protein [Candidatus Eisenbacteria bacterium]